MGLLQRRHVARGHDHVCAGRRECASGLTARTGQAPVITRVFFQIDALDDVHRALHPVHRPDDGMPGNVIQFPAADTGLPYAERVLNTGPMPVQPAAFLRTTLPLSPDTIGPTLAQYDSGRYHSIWLPDHMVSFWPDSI